MEPELKSPDAALEAIRAEIAPIVAKANIIADIQSPEAEARAVEFLVQIKRRYDMMDAARTFLVKPLNEHVKKINAQFKQDLVPLDEAEAKVKAGMTAWRGSEAFKKLEEARVTLEQEALHAVKTGDTGAIAAIGAEHAMAAQMAPTQVESMSGKAHFRDTTKFEVTDESLIPDAFWSVDEKKIGAAVKAGAKEIPGVRIWTEQTPVIR